MSEPMWTDEQKIAILASEDVLLTANAGAGKTTTVVGRILWLIGVDVGLGVNPEPCRLDEIAAITFTEKAAHDLKQKLREEIEKSDRAAELLWQIDRAALGTIHSFCGQILREYALRLGIDPTFTTLDERASHSEQNEVIREVLLGAIADGDAGAENLIDSHTLRGYQFSAGAIDHIRNVMRDMRWHGERYARWSHDGELDIDALRRMAGKAWDDLDEDTAARCAALVRLAHAANHAWLRRMRDENFRDFDALILDTRDLLTSEVGRHACESLRRRYRILVIDEFQDTDAAQRDIAYAIARGHARPQLFLVGDPKQSIYGFRGADISVWNQVAADFGPSATLTLHRNFRSDPALIDFVNTAMLPAMNSVAENIATLDVDAAVRYSELVPGRDPLVGGVEWLRHADSKSEREWIGARIEQIVGRQMITDRETGEKRPCRYSDIAVLYRSRAGGAEYQGDLRRRGIPFYEQGQVGLTARQEVQDVINALRVLHNPDDDLTMFGFLRSPFVGLRDEVIARIQIDSSISGRTLLDRARRYVEAGEWFEPPEHDRICAIERQALTAAIGFIDRMEDLAPRLPLDELIEHIVDATGYRAHLHLLDGAREALANIRSVVRVAEEFRDRQIGTFLDLWDQWDDEDLGLPQAPLYSSRDDVVTLSTIHAAKGLEWPVVFLINVGATERDKFSNAFWSDDSHGPILCPKKDDRGLRSQAMQLRRAVEERAEEVRLLYVAATRARDRLVIIGGDKPISFGSWLAAAGHLVEGGIITALPPEPETREQRAIPLAWMDAIESADEIDSVKPLAQPQPRWITSATELMQRARDEKTWDLLYRKGVQPSWMFTRRLTAASGNADDAAIPATLRGTIVHGVLERIREEEELASLLEETIGELAAPELENALTAGSAYRNALEDEIRRVVRSDEWKWYVEGDHHRELSFMHLAAARDWRTGAFDLFRFDGAGNRIIDFKTHVIDADGVREASRDYVIQARIYREAAEIAGGASVHLHFTGPNVVVDMEYPEAGPR